MFFGVMFEFEGVNVGEWGEWGEWELMGVMGVDGRGVADAMVTKTTADSSIDLDESAVVLSFVAKPIILR